MNKSDIYDKINKIEEIISRDPENRRGTELMYDFYQFAKGNLLKSAKSIVENPNPHVGIISGFYLVHGEPPCCETDGPPGAAHLAAGLHRAGISCRILTDRPNIGAISAAVRATELLGEIPLDVASVIGNGGDGGTPLNEIENHWKSLEPPITHVVAIERVGPSKDGIARNAHGVEMTCYNAPLERLFQGNSWETIGIGDGGNELGMGNLSQDIIAKNVRNGDQIACVVECDYLLICGVSNWGAQALLAAMSLLKPKLKGALLKGLTRKMDKKILNDCVFKGPAVSVATWHKWPHVPTQCLSVDGLSWDVNVKIMEDILKEIEWSNKK